MKAKFLNIEIVIHPKDKRPKWYGVNKPTKKWVKVCHH